MRSMIKNGSDDRPPNFVIRGTTKWWIPYDIRSDADHATKWYGAAPARGCEATGGGNTFFREVRLWDFFRPLI